MPDAVVTAPAAPSAAPPASPAPSSAPPSSSPSITFGGDQGKPVESPKPAEHTEAPASDADLKFDFGFEDQGPIEATAGDETSESLNYADPFDPAIEELLKNSPEQLKKLKASYYDNRNWKKSGFKTAQEAANHLRDLNSLATSFNRKDGTAGIEAIKAEAKDWSDTYQGFQNGDAATVQRVLSEVSPEASNKLISAALKVHQEKNPQAWARTMAQTFMGELRAQNAKGESILTALNRLVQVSDNPEAKAMLSTIAEQINQLDEIGRAAPADTTAAASTDKEKALAERERGLFVKELSGRVMPQINSAAQKAAETILRGRQLGKDAKSTFVQEITAEYNRLSRTDKDFQKNAKSLLENGDQDGFERLVRAQIIRKMPDAARNINRKFSGFSQDTSQRRAEGEARVESAAGGSLTESKRKYTGKTVNGAPDPAVIDWQRMRQVSGGRRQAEEMLFEHRFYVKGQKDEFYF